MTDFVPTTFQSLMVIVAQLLVGQTAAGSRVFTPRTFPTWKNDYPMILVRRAHEHKQGTGRNGASQFNTTGTLSIIIRCTAPGAVADAAAEIAQDAAWDIKRQVEVALVNATPLMIQLQQIPTIDSEGRDFGDGAQPVAEVRIALALEWFEDPRSFAPPEITDLEGADVSTDLVNVFDAVGTYVPDFPYSVAAAPRTSGPDGRDEGPRLVIDLSGDA